MQTLFAISCLRGAWMRALYCLLLGGVCFGIHPWVLDVNFIRMNQFLESDAALFLMASGLFLESVLKAFFYLHNDEYPPRSRHWVNRWIHRLSQQTGQFIRNTPSFMMVFFLFYTQSFFFHNIESIPFHWMAGIMAFSLFIFLFSGSFILWKTKTHERLCESEFNLLFIQFVLSIALPLMKDGMVSGPHMYNATIYFQALITIVSLLAVIVIGYIITTARISHNRSSPILRDKPHEKTGLTTLNR